MNLAETIQDLFSRYGNLSGITIECQKELLAIGVVNQAAKAEVFLQGAQVARYQRHQESPILFLSRACDYRQGLPLRGGIPLCWPWFGQLQRNPDALQQQFSAEARATAPAHGFIRERDWQLSDIRIVDETCTVLELSCIIAADTEKYWPFSAALTYTIEVGTTLKARLNIENRDHRHFMFSAALHSYLQVEHIDSVCIKGFDGASYTDALNDWQLATQQGDLAFAGEVDRIYHMAHAPEKTLLLMEDKRSTTITPQGSASTVVWNPWVEKSKGLSQFNEGDYRQMVCIETANALEDCVSLAPGESHSLGVVLQ